MPQYDHVDIIISQSGGKLTWFIAVIFLSTKTQHTSMLPVTLMCVGDRGGGRKLAGWINNGLDSMKVFFPSSFCLGGESPAGKPREHSLAN